MIKIHENSRQRLPIILLGCVLPYILASEHFSTADDFDITGQPNNNIFEHFLLKIVTYNVVTENACPDKFHNLMKTVSIQVSQFPIRLGQFLKHACIVSDGVEGKALISNGQVLVNGEPEHRRGRQLSAGDAIFVGDISYTCTPLKK